MRMASNIMPLRARTAPLFRGQSVSFPDPDLPLRHGRPVITEGVIHSFDEERGEVLVVLEGEPQAARRFNDHQLSPL